MLLFSGLPLDVREADLAVSVGWADGGRAGLDDFIRLSRVDRQGELGGRRDGSEETREGSGGGDLLGLEWMSASNGMGLRQTRKDVDARWSSLILVYLMSHSACLPGSSPLLALD